MREIKFRAWDIRREKYAVTKEDPITPESFLSDVYYPFDPEDLIWQQYTGITDDNGKEIYEEDILKDENGNIYQVVWSNWGFRWGIKNEGQVLDYGLYTLVTSGHPSEIEVIGNIYENPELLEDK